VPLLALAAALVTIVLCPSAVVLPLVLAVVTALLPPVLLARCARAGMLGGDACITMGLGDGGLRWTWASHKGRIDGSEDHAADQ
jgi:hypothetical protein